jgi:LuxR family transcriptional regulator, maltose regulon positive regulatory protein
VLLTLLLNDLTTQQDDVILILEDYHLVPASTIHRAMAFLLDNLPPRVHLLITARADPPLPLSQLRARGQLTELRIADLRFTIEETAAFLDHTMGLQLSADDVAALSTRTEGWIAGLQLAALSLRGRDPAHLSGAIAALTGSHQYILDYLADQVFDRQPLEVRRFLLHTAVLDRLNGALCDALAGETDPAFVSDDGQLMLERLEAASLFIVPLDDTRTWFRYHHLFADFLRERLRRDDPDHVPELHRRACRWYARQGLLTDAVDHALAASDFADAARLIEQVGTTLLWQRGEMLMLLRWQEQLPRDAARVRPRLCLDLAWASAWSDQADAVESRLQDAEQALDTLDTATPATNRSSDAPSRALRGEIAALRVELARQSGDIAAAIDLARQALAYLPADARRLRGITLGNLARAYLWNCDASAASHALAEAVALNQTRDTITLALFASGRLVQVQALQGRLHQAAATYQHTLDLAVSYGVPATAAIGVAKVSMAEVLREWNELDAAEDLARQAITQCTASGGLADSALDGSLTLARVLQARGDLDGALGQLREAEALGRDSHVVQYTERVAVTRAHMQLTSSPGDLAAVVRWAGEHEAAWGTDLVPGLVGLRERLALARLRIVQGRPDDAAALLARLLTIAEAGGLTGFVIEILALQARILLEAAQEAQAMIALNRALSLAEPEAYVRLFVDEGTPVVALLRQAQARAVAPTYVAALLTACGNAPQSAFPDGVALVEPLSARELALLRLVAAGLSTHEIAARLYVTAGTVRTHLKNIGRKLDVHSRLQAVERARALGLL